VAACIEDGMPTKTILLVAMTGLLFSCQPERKTTTETRTESVEEATERAARAARAEAAEAKVALAKRLDQLDAEIDNLETKAKKATAKTRAKLSAEAKELRADAARLRGSMSTWDEKVAAGARTAKNEVEEDLQKTEAAIKKLAADLKD
jgi:uncharacterized protein YicC (UPF0701 family)